MPTTENATSERGDAHELALTGSRPMALGGQQPSGGEAAHRDVPGRQMLLSGSAEFRGPVAHRKPVAG